MHQPGMHVDRCFPQSRLLAPLENPGLHCIPTFGRGEAVRGVSKSQLPPTKSAQMACIIHSVTGGLVGGTKPSKSFYIVGMGK